MRRPALELCPDPPLLGPCHEAWGERVRAGGNAKVGESQSRGSCRLTRPGSVVSDGRNIGSRDWKARWGVNE